MDFVRGANLSKGGRSIIALHSTTKNEAASKIVTTLTTGAPVTTSRCDVNYIVTEYGVAQLRGQTLRERAKRLIAIAHPKFRPELAEEYEAPLRREARALIHHPSPLVDSRRFAGLMISNPFKSPHIARCRRFSE